MCKGRKVSIGREHSHNIFALSVQASHSPKTFEIELAQYVVKYLKRQKGEMAHRRRATIRECSRIFKAPGLRKSYHGSVCLAPVVREGSEDRFLLWRIFHAFVGCFRWCWAKGMAELEGRARDV